ncbi:hypothetical protein JOE65_000382 [Arthrobacter roseus]|nr:hypothetical protein [Arthrobacter roseus]
MDNYWTSAALCLTTLHLPVDNRIIPFFIHTPLGQPPVAFPTFYTAQIGSYPVKE